MRHSSEVNKKHLLIAIVALAYLTSFRGAFQFDDYNVIVDNPVVHTLGAWFRDLSRGIRPLLKLTYTLNWISGMGVFGFHVVNLAIHSANAVLIYHLTSRFIKRAAVSAPEGADGAAFLTALLWAVHPIGTEAVTYISGRSTSLMAMFYLASLAAYARGSDTGKGLWLYLISPVLFVLSVLAKETAVTLPLALLLWDLTGGKTSCWGVLKRQALHWGLLSGMLLALILHNNYWVLIDYSLGIRGFEENLLSEINGISYLVSRVVWVWGLNIDPDLPVLSGWSPLLYAEAAFLGLLFVAGVLSLKGRPWLGFGLLWFFVHLIPTNTLLPRLDIANERQMYLPLWGMLLIFAPGASRSNINRRVLISGAVILTLVLGSFTVLRNHTYRSEVALWEDTAGKSPLKPRAFNNLGYAYYQEGRYDEAKEAFVRALALKPDYAIAKNNLERLLSKPR